MGVRVITPESGLHTFRNATRRLREEFGNALSLAKQFFVRDTKAEHRQSLLGYVWLVVPVLANTLTWVFLNSQKVVNIDTGNVPYGMFVLSGVVLWTAFNGGVMSMLGVVTTARSVLSKVNFPHESLIYAAMLRSLLDASLAGLVLIPAILIFGVKPGASALLYPISLIFCLILGWSIGLVLVPISALYGDVSRAFQLVLRFGFFFTPVIFPTPAGGIARKLMLANPVTPILASGRSWLTGSGEAIPSAFLVVGIVSILLFFLALLVFKVALPYIIERVGG
jgi:lipopolysaccharide transport system permease protein